jgi:hypothetical protein
MTMSQPLTVDDLFRLFQETDRQFKETDRKFQETDRKIQDTDRQLKEIGEYLRETDRQLREAKELFVGRWGRLMDALVKPSVLRLFQERGVPVNHTLERAESRIGGEEMEVDLLLVDGDALVEVEVKTTLRVEDVRDLQRDLQRLTRFFPEYRGMRLFGAVAYLNAEEEADRYADRQGFFVLRMGKEGLVEMANDAGFQPRDYAERDGLSTTLPGRENQGDVNSPM